MRKNQYIADAAMLGAIYVLLYLGGMFLPVIGMFLVLALSLPFVLYSYRYDLKKFSLFCLVTAILTGIIGGIINIPSVVFFALLGGSIGYSYKKREKSSQMFMRAILLAVIGLLVILVITQLLFQTNFIADFKVMLNESKDTMISVFQTAGVEITSEQKEVISSSISLMFNTLPLMLVSAAAVITLLTCYISQLVFKRLHMNSVPIGKVRDFQLPTYLIWIYLIVLLCNFITFDSTSFFYTVLLNMTLLFQGLFIMQGYSFIAYFLHIKNKSKGFFIAIFMLTIFVPILIPIIEFLGIIDLGFQLRKRLVK